ncbi:SDR family NAD(P)-dependent oxidoreductase [Paraflavitalea pollutisoli]|uniref:SDR family NAD(P)-dependent oxidoreductase n=1 Tax=Paraflavitalea pollutisoli TaxID=3034143 RepID=UPI0023EDDD3F|nr:SDR family NAD(P)-dependent oxidoreductase [Paraflavitalea sp. H1-2-19X]
MKDRIAIISGGSSGIGKATACELAAQGVRIVLVARKETALLAAREEIIARTGASCLEWVVGDVCEEWVTAACIDKCLDTWNAAPDIFVASAGRGLPGTLITSDQEAWDTLIDVNIKGLMRQLRCISQHMKSRTSPDRDFISHPLDIVVVGSTIGRNVSPFNSVYGATKFAAHGLTEALRRELGPLGIRVTLVEPGLTGTNFQETAGYDLQWFESYSREVGPILTPQDVATVIRYIVGFPGNVHMDNVSIRPTRQAYP